MSHSWDNVASMHDHLLTVHTHKASRRSSCRKRILPGPSVPCACADGSDCGGHTPHSKQLQRSVQWRRSNAAIRLLTGMTRDYTSPFRWTGNMCTTLLQSTRSTLQGVCNTHSSTNISFHHNHPCTYTWA